jgi:superfamily II DNA helicase RecQ
MWNPDLLLDYYLTIDTSKYNEEQFLQFLQIKVMVLLEFFHMLRPIEAWKSKLIEKPELELDINKGCWLRILTKNNKESFSDVWIPNNDLLIEEKDLRKGSHPLNIFQAIQDIKKKLGSNTNAVFIDLKSRSKISFDKYKKLVLQEMRKMNIPPFFTIYSLKHTTIQKLVRSKMELAKINKVGRFASGSTTALNYYSPHYLNKIIKSNKKVLES